MTLQPQEEEDQRLSAPDWEDKYRWPDPVDGWSGPLAGYPPDHPVRRGSKIALKLIARKYWADPKVTRYREWITGWPEVENDKLARPPVWPEVENVTKLSPEMVDVTKPSVTKPTNVTEPTPVAGDVTKPAKGGRPSKSGQAMTAAERKRASRERKDKPDLMSDALAAAVEQFSKRSATEAPDDDLPHEERVRRDRERKKATRELWAKTKGQP